MVSGFIHAYVYYLVGLAFLLPLFAADALRLHDTGRSVRWPWLSLVQVIGGLVMLFFTVQPSTPDGNEYGLPAAV